MCTTVLNEVASESLQFRDSQSGCDETESATVAWGLELGFYRW